MARTTTTGGRSRRTGTETAEPARPAEAAAPGTAAAPETAVQAEPEAAVRPGAAPAEPTDGPAAQGEGGGGPGPVGNPTAATGPESEAASDAGPGAAAAPSAADAPPGPDPVDAAGASPAPPPPPPPAPAVAVPVARRGGVIGPLVGGILAAGIGAAAVLWLLPQGWQPASDAIPAELERRLAALETAPAAETVDLAPLLARLAALEAAAQGPGEAPPFDGEARVGALEERVAALEAGHPAPDPGPVLAAFEARLDRLEARVAAARLDEVETRLAALDSRMARAEDLTSLAGRIAVLEAAVPGLVEAAVAQAVGRLATDLQARIEAEAAAVQASAEDAAIAEARAERLALAARLGLAAENGAPAPEVLARLEALGVDTAGLAAFADGLPTLAQLQAGFAPAARAALAAAPAPEDAGAVARLVGFLRAQTGARSLAPREGGDTDAILSRAEAALRQADLADALDELAALPPGPAAEMAAWRTRAEARLAALAALAELRARLGEE